jgi:hypothetical protein
VSSSPVRPPSIEPTSFFSGLRPWAIVVGAVVDGLATLAAFTVLVILLALEHGIAISEEIPDEVLDSLLLSPEGLFWSFVLGGLCTMFGAFVGARRAGCHFVRHGAFVGLASLLLGVAGLFFPSSEQAPPLWYDFLSIIAIVPLGAAGGWLAAQRRGPRAP